ncbi:HEAT repeat domain-containing protein [Pendulispora albinea]|uniref:HEAT repeat domain-containing protein n=1 Tax=Pendulispora albinea TaxID=2741071 RepID=A0ABZ2LW11_9BACT
MQLGSVARSRSPLRLVALLLALPATAHATTEGSAPAGGGLAAIAVSVDLAAGSMRYGSEAVAIELDRNELPDGKSVRIAPVAVGEGRNVVHVVVPSKTRKAAWEAIVAGGESGKGRVVYAGVTGLTRGRSDGEGDRTGAAVDVLARGDGTSIVAVGDLREDLRLCGRETTLLSPQVLDPKSMQLRGASLQRLPRAQRDGAERIAAGLRGGPADVPIGRLLAATGASTALGKPAALTDGNPSTTWAEARSGMGLGEFVVMRAPEAVPLVRFQLTVAPPGANATAGTAPRSFFLVTDTKTFSVTLPEDGWLKPGASYDIALKEPARTSCVALVLDQAYARSNARPEVALAELTAYSEFDVPNASTVSVARLLFGGGPRAQAAAAVLQRAGKRGVDGVMEAWNELDPAGRALGVDVAVITGCEDGAPLLIASLDDKDRNVERKGREKLERCGRAAGPGLVRALGEGPVARRAKLASLLAFLAPSAGLAPIAALLGQGTAADRQTTRGAFLRAARSAEPGKLTELLHDPGRNAEGRLELLRAMGPRIADVRDDALPVLDDLLKNAPSFQTRYVALGPIAELARGGDRASLDRFAALMSRDKEWPVRARAAELALQIPGARQELIERLRDPEPRPREAALRAIAEERLSAAAVTVEALLARDPWTFVRVAAASALGAMPQSPDIDAALAAGLEDPLPQVRVAAVEALGVHRAATYAARVRTLLDEDNAPEVHLAGVHTLAQMCDGSALDRLTELATKAAAPNAEANELTLGLASIDALGKIHPPDLARRLAKVTGKDVRAQVRGAAQLALAAPGICKR